LTARLKLSAAMLPVALGLALAGCAKPQSATDPTITGAIAHPVTQTDFDKATAYWAQRYEQNQKDKDAAMNYAAALMRAGNAAQAVAVLQATAINFPADRSVLAALGKALAATGDLNQALATIQQAEDPGAPDWRLLSAEGAILDQMNRNDDARNLYAKAQALAPTEPSILSNYAMSYVMTGELPKAEKLLRQAIALPGADTRIRQNLALVVGLQGRFSEAEKIASADLSAEDAAANVAYLKQMLSQQNSWQQLRAGQAGQTQNGQNAAGQPPPA
jgi:Flp pilus assembly protein TadD